ncbi:ThrRS/AlaRS common domain-containing protein [Aspergillus saccharolyticus JOP 1030-1]|uniref:ThrRS/AlaRS common domain-containing protein n=1 Tax=Aspergillus saccharolyticus JOP 1030-1 TaxID=1450539 RepID=A0A318Z6T5_9EURO|nr:ThrRS/AlaRS common domain-containing protein [Aspergillus saccharolyticus JOP 1030-1]PYH42154.1 ThrRS/AlaRS common domain-containing protein [Aspergillus saccharolyticus JOP 1030-1]
MFVYLSILSLISDLRVASIVNRLCFGYLTESVILSTLADFFNRDTHHARIHSLTIPQTSTEALYLDDASLVTTTTTILSYQPVSALPDPEKSLAKNIPPEDYALTTRHTVFYPQGGGQPSDTGVIVVAGSENPAATFEVRLVRKTLDGTILHFGRFATTPTFPLAVEVGSLVTQTIDAVKRNYHSRLHTAGHIIGLAMRLLVPELGERRKVKANHAPREACMEFEGLLYNEHKPLIEGKVNELVQQALPVHISWWAESEIQEKELNMVEGLQLGADGRVRIAEIADLDANPCGGTHVAHTGLTGYISIRKISRQKGVTKLSYEVPVQM